jgi:hypothetical protein
MSQNVNPTTAIKRNSVRNVDDVRLLARRNHLVLMLKQFSKNHHQTDSKMDFASRAMELALVECQLAKRGLLRVAVTSYGKAALTDPAFDFAATDKPVTNRRYH